MVILALDQATATGYAVIGEGGEILTSGTVHLADKNRTGESRGMRYVRFRKFLCDMVEQYGVDLFVHEQTLLRGGAATEIANGLKGVILMVAAERGIEVSCVHTSELKKFATGSGRADKEQMVCAAKRLTNRVPCDDNEADALLIGLWAYQRFAGAKGTKETQRDPFGIL